ncbi:hypothetical protein BSKO_07445 [Bryopsis sp. KO-2023]|nr:hypothetical protein BSKO_07445 [Bryopsis sp. KO-2023]
MTDRSAKWIYKKSSYDINSDRSLIKNRLQKLHAQAKVALKRRKSVDKNNTKQQDEAQDEAPPEPEPETDLEGTSSPEDTMSGWALDLVERLPTWKVKTRTARASIHECLSPGGKYGDKIDRTESLKGYFDMAMAQNAEDFKQQQAKIFSLYRAASMPSAGANVNESLILATICQEARSAPEGQSTDPRLNEFYRLKGDAEALLRMYKNRTNARWVEDEEWVSPSIVNPRTLLSGSAIGDVHKYNAKRLVSEARLALMLIDDCERIVTAEGKSHSVMTADLWQIIREFWPSKIPQTHRIEGLSTTGRKLLQTAVVLERQYGEGILSHLKLVVAVDNEEEVAFVKELCAWRFFGFHHEHVVIVTVPRFPGFINVPGSDEMKEVRESGMQPAGTGYAMLLLNSPAEGYTISKDCREPNFLPGSVLEWLESCGVTWLLTNMTSDVDRMRTEAYEQIVDLQFIASTLYAEEYQNANMGLEVLQACDTRDIRRHGSLVLSRRSQPQLVCNLKAGDLQTPATYQLIQNGDTEMYMSNRQYLFSVPHLSKILTGPTMFHPEIDVKNSCYAYISFDLADLTTADGARCAGVMSRNQSRKASRDRTFDRQWVYDVVDLLEAQDGDQMFRSMAIRVSQGLNRLGLGVDEGEMAANSLGAVLVVDNDIVSKMAMRLASHLIIKLFDRLNVVTWGPASEKTKHILDGFKDEELDFNQQIVREVVDTGTERSYNAALRQHISTVNGKLLILGVDDLTRMGSFVRHAVKNITDVHILVVKSDSLGKLFRTPDTNHLTVMALLENNPTEMIEWLNQRLKPGRDVLQVARTLAFDKSGLLSVSSRRILANARLCADSRFQIEEKTYGATAIASLPAACAKEQMDILVVSATSGLDLPKHLSEILLAAKTSVLIYRSQATTGRTSSLA